MAGSAFRIAGSEVRRFRGLLPVIALIFIVLVPLIYGAIYVTANWDPYNRLSNLPVAIVNHDQPAQARTKTIRAGDDLTHKLVAQHHFDWHTTDAGTARRGLADGRYYLTLTIPSDFSTNLVSAKSFDPRRAKIRLQRNDANGFIIGTVTSSSQNQIEQTVNESVVNSYFRVVFSELSQLKSGLTDASGASKKLASGTKKSHKAAHKLSKGAAKTDKGAQRLHTGAASLSSGLGTADSSASDVSSGLQSLGSNSEDLADGASDVANSTGTLSGSVLPSLTALQKSTSAAAASASRASQALSGVAHTVAGANSSVASDLDQGDVQLNELADKHPGLADDPAYRKLTQRMSSASDRASRAGDNANQQARDVGKINDDLQADNSDISDSISEAKSDITSLNNGAHQVSRGASKLHSGIARASAGADSLADGVSKADKAASKLKKGSGKLATGTDKLKAGNHDLSEGLGRLSSGASNLHKDLKSSAQNVPTVTAGKRSHAAEVLAAPAKVDLTVHNPATFYGRGLAPMFFAIALWVFGITAFLVIRALSNRSRTGRATLFALSLGSWLPPAALAVLGGLVMIGVCWLFLGLDPVRPLAFVGITALGAAAFAGIAQLLRMAFGLPGSAILLVWLIVQLSSTGGTYPPPVLPQFFAAINPYMPMTYLIDAFRLTISGGEMVHLVRDAIILGSITVVAFGLIMLVVARRRRFSRVDLRPALTAP
jgi:putative membrane protein